MKVKDVAAALELKALTGDCGLDREVNGAYCCDLLSWVMSHAEKENIWVTVQVHPNIVAVAVLLELSCIIIPEEIKPEEVTIEKAVSEGIPILISRENGFKICCRLKELGI
jgi:hypothetical protein